MAVSAQTTTQEAPPGLFGRGLRLIVLYIRMHPRPFLISVAGAVLFAFGSIALTTALGRATDDVLRPAFEGGVSSREIWLSVAALMAFGCLRALGIWYAPLLQRRRRRAGHGHPPDEDRGALPASSRSRITGRRPPASSWRTWRPT